MATMSEPKSTAPLPTGDELRQQMRAIRRELGADVEELVGHAEKLMDWRYYVRQYPWATVGVAAFLGYLLVPSGKASVNLSGHAMAELAQQMGLGSQQDTKAWSEPEPKKTSLMGSLITMGTNFAIRSAMTYAGQQAGKILGQQMAQMQPQEPQQHESHHGV